MKWCSSFLKNLRSQLFFKSVKRNEWYMLNFHNSLASGFSFLSHNNEVLDTHNNKLIRKCWHVINTAVFVATLR